GRWPVKSCKVVLGLLRNAEANAEFKNLDTEKLFVEHVQASSSLQLPVQRSNQCKRNCPCHVEMILSEKEEAVEKAETEEKPKKFTRKQFARLRLKVPLSLTHTCWRFAGVNSCQIVLFHALLLVHYLRRLRR
ncbi:unnamed protein product, partial [Durusdinium trenchii]